MNELRPPSQGLGLGSSGNKTPAITPPPKLSVNHGAAEDQGSIGLVGDSESTGESKIRALAGGGASVRKENYKRQPVISGKGACRVRSFHGRLSAQGLEYMDNQINEWIDANPEVEVKFVSSQVGIFEGKMREPALILNLWY